MVISACGLSAKCSISPIKRSYSKFLRTTKGRRSPIFDHFIVKIIHFGEYERVKTAL